MALPTLIKTWEFKTNWLVYGGYTHDTLMQYVACDVKDLLCDFVPRVGAYAEGSFTFASPTVTYTAPDSRFDPTLIGNMVGKTVRVKGATTAGNDGEFTITAQTSTTLQWSNASGAAEALAGSLNIFNGDFTTPWEINHTGTDTAHGTEGDGIDMLAGNPTDIGGGTGNVGYWVLKNPATGTYWSLSTDSSSGSTGLASGNAVIRAALAPNTMEKPSSLSEPPHGTVLEDGSNAHIQYSANNQYWLGDPTDQFSTVKINVWMSSDGEQTRLAIAGDGTWAIAWLDAVVQNPHPSWDAGGGIATPVVTAMRCNNTAALSSIWTHATFNDGPSIHGSEIPWPGPGVSPTGGTEAHRTSFYCTGEGFASQQNAQYVVGVNTLTGEYELYPWGIFTLNYGRAGRHGEIPDIWWCGTDIVVGDTFPDSTARQFVAIGDIVLPWNGDYFEVT